MYDQNLHEYCKEFYSLEKAIDIWVVLGGANRNIRIEALRNEKSEHYIAIAFVRIRVSVKPADKFQYGGHGDSVEYNIWADYDLPTTDGNSADQVLTLALSHIGEAARRGDSRGL